MAPHGRARAAVHDLIAHCGSSLRQASSLVGLIVHLSRRITNRTRLYRTRRARLFQSYEGLFLFLFLFLLLFRLLLLLLFISRPRRRRSQRSVWESLGEISC